MNQIEIKIEKTFKDDFYQLAQKQQFETFDNLMTRLEMKTGLKKNTISNISDLKKWFDNILSLKEVETILERNDFEEFIIHSPQKASLSLQGNKQECPLNGFDDKDLQTALEYLAHKNGQFWNYTNPFVSFKCSISKIDLRCTLIHKSTCPSGHSKAFFRRQSSMIHPLDSFCENNSKEIMCELIKNKRNIIISGSTGSGKTSFIKSLLYESSEPDEHIIILEDTDEIERKTETWTKLLSVNQKGKTLKDFCHYALRMSPDRMVLGEIRSSEVIPFVLSMNNGHKGLLSTVHANSANDTLSRLSLLFSLYNDSSGSIDHQTINQLMAQSIDYVVHLKNKKVHEISKVISWHGQRPTFEHLYKKAISNTLEDNHGKSSRPFQIGF
ncbi:CpaF/VirB11 family protein [Halobacteriovorax sp. GB3]|uniref:CpaF/VirB11 family protein n=1 Tax=Halobacteriovorax sp. GB3 TaxID=2719615 RepID=UPI00235FBD9D|nr:CpaF/VirB11 family protein [Halobacteriovorax sp. GB3]MDD0853708.1 CpaF/VirB11 family protein [Halobacteriovorax sp. GB3]